MRPRCVVTVLSRTPRWRAITDVRCDAHPLEHPFEKLRRHIGLIVQILIAELAVVGTAHANRYHGVLRADPDQTVTRLLQDGDLDLLLAHAELCQGRVDGLLNAWGASLDLLHHCLRTPASSAACSNPADHSRASESCPVAPFRSAGGPALLGLGPSSRR